MTARALAYLHAASPLHIGTGQALDVIDLPIQRERSTGLPVVGGSALKGVIRAECEGLVGTDQQKDGFVESAFGHDKDPQAGAGAVTFSDARLLLFPVRSVRLLFAWVTSPYLLRRYVRDRKVAGLDTTKEEAALEAAGSLKEKSLCAHEHLLVMRNQSRTVFIEDADLPAEVHVALTNLAGALAARCLPEQTAPLLTERLLIVDDSLIGTLVRQCTEISARVRLDDDKKTVARGGLWYEEALPAESVLYAPVYAEATRSKEKKFSGKDHVDHLAKVIQSAQFGGKASVGRGLCDISWESGA